MTLVDYNGNSFDTSTMSNGLISFSFPKNMVGISLIGTTFDSNVEVNYQAQAVNTAAGTTTTTPPPQMSSVAAPTASSTSSSAAGSRLSPYIRVIEGVISFVILALDL
jgi:hypothetical protein